MAGKKKALRWVAAIIGVLLVGVAWLVGPELMAMNKAGFFEETAERNWDGGAADNLKVLYTGLKGYQDSEGVLPEKEWMDAIWPRLQANDLSDEEAEKKFSDPDFGEYGFVLNQELLGNHTEDVPPETIVVFQGKSHERNAVGDPKADARDEKAIGINAAGEVVGLDGARPPSESGTDGDAGA